MAIKKLDDETTGDNYRPVKITVKDTSTEDAAKAKSFQDKVGAVGTAGNMVGEIVDPQAEGAGAALSGAASGAGVGATVGGPYGAAIGAAIGLGLGVIKADQNRKANKAARDAQAAAIMGEGLKDASQEMLKKQFRFGTSNNRSTFGSKRNLK